MPNDHHVPAGLASGASSSVIARPRIGATPKVAKHPPVTNATAACVGWSFASTGTEDAVVSAKILKRSASAFELVDCGNRHQPELVVRVPPGNSNQSAGSLMGSSRNTSEFRIVKIAVFASMPDDNVRIAAKAKAGD
jgi:hypothetical protein